MFSTPSPYQQIVSPFAKHKAFGIWIPVVCVCANGCLYVNLLHLFIQFSQNRIVKHKKVNKLKDQAAKKKNNRIECNSTTRSIPYDRHFLVSFSMKNYFLAKN